MAEFEERKQSIKALADQGKFEDALAKCDSLLAQSPDSRGDVLRLRAYIYSPQGRYEQAMLTGPAIG